MYHQPDHDPDSKKEKKTRFHWIILDQLGPFYPFLAALGYKANNAHLPKAELFTFWPRRAQLSGGSPTRRMAVRGFRLPGAVPGTPHKLGYFQKTPIELYGYI